MNKHFKFSLIASAMLAAAVMTTPTLSFAADNGSKSISSTISVNSIKSFSDGGNTEIRLSFSSKLAAVPKHFMMTNPYRVVMDVPNAVNSTGQRLHDVIDGQVQKLNLIQAEGATRVVAHLKGPTVPLLSIEGNDLVMKFGEQVKQAENAIAEIVKSSANQLTAIDFRRGPAGEGRIIVDVSETNSGIEIKQIGSNVQIDFESSEIAEQLMRRMNVTDFGTPVQNISLSKYAKGVRLVVEPKGLWEYSSFQTDNRFVLEVRPIAYDPNKLVQSNNAGYKGERMSLNFQNIDVRNLINVIADFTKINIVTSDSVSGAMSIKLDDVPWDQALDIIMQSRGLDMRKNGNVIWVAPSAEIATREKDKLENTATAKTLEPLRTSTYRLNYTNADDVHAILSKKEHNLLSERGSILVDSRTNQLMIKDIPSQIEELEKVIKKLDISVSQVMIEARIVEAGDKFSRNLGARLGFVQAAPTQMGGGGVLFGSTASGTGFMTGQVKDTPDFLTQGTNVNLPGAAMDTGAQLGTFAMTLLNGAGTKFLNLELSALEADGRGKIVSSPSVVTADKEKALIEQGTEIPYAEASASGAATVSFKKANLRLEVLPQITPDGNVIMTVEINKDAPGGATTAGLSIDTKHIKTKVLVENGGTIVIGGIFTQEERNDVNKVPFLGDLPFIGNVFKNTAKKDVKTELMIFLTPRILENKTQTAR